MIDRLTKQQLSQIEIQLRFGCRHTALISALRRELPSDPCLSVMAIWNRPFFKKKVQPWSDKNSCYPVRQVRHILRGMLGASLQEAGVLQEFCKSVMLLAWWLASPLSFPKVGAGLGVGLGKAGMGWVRLGWAGLG